MTPLEINLTWWGGAWGLVAAFAWLTRRKPKKEDEEK